MSAIGTSLTLLDVAKRLDPNGSISAIAEVLNDTNGVLQDMPFIEGNLPTGHVSTIRTGLPSATWRLLNYGVTPAKSVTAQVTDAIGSLEAYSQVDKRIADLNGNTSAFRVSEDRAHLEAMNQSMASTIFYGDTAQYPERFVGLAPRYNDKTAPSGENMLSGGSSDSGGSASVWLVHWGPNTVHGIYAKGSKAGLSMEDKGQQTVTDAAGGLYEAYRTHYKWENGIVVKDWRYAARLCNIDVSALTKNAGSGADLIDLLTQLVELPPSSMGKPVLYCSKTVRSFLRRQIMNKSNVNLTLESVAGKPVVAFDGIPVVKCDALLETESVISGF